MLETELKSMLDEEVYKKIQKMYAWDSIKEQENHYYFDTNRVLSQNHTVFRIRKKDGEYKVQIKEHKNQGSPLQICEETEFLADSAPDMILSESAKKYFAAEAEVGDLVKIGFNTTLRHSFMWDEFTEICLDKTDYLGETDYEIEIEYTNGCPEKLKNELAKAGVKFDKKSVGKYTRFIMKFQEQMK